MRNRGMLAVGMLVQLLGSAALQAADAGSCQFAWDVSHEQALFNGTAQTVAAGRALSAAPRLEPNQLYELALAPQDQVSFAVAPGKKMLSDGAYGGVTHVHIAQAGAYRVSLSAPFWIDLAAGDKLITSGDFTGSSHCDTPRKIVQFALPAGDLVLQLSGATSAQVRVTITSAPTSNAGTNTGH